MDKSNVSTFLVVLLVVCSGVATASGPSSGLSSTPDRPSEAGESTETLETVLEGTNETQVVVQLESADVSPEMSSKEVIRTLKRHANRTQQSVEIFAVSHEGVTIVRQFWLTNTVVLEVDQSRANLTAIANVEDVTGLHTNFEVNVSRPTDNESLRPTDRESRTTANRAESPTATNRTTVANGTERSTTPLSRIGVPEAWNEFDARGDGVKVAVLDSGIDISHPDIDLYTTDSEDPTYPGGWAEFDEDGQRVPNSTPRTEGAHGTHTSGIVAGGNASGTYVGVAPDAELMHGLVVTDSTGSFARILAGIQWAVEQDADVLSVSLGVRGYHSEFVEPLQRAESAGTVVVASTGNEGPGTGSLPANVYESVGVGAVTQDETVADFSGAKRIDTESAWGSAAPDDWPSQYTIPDLVAPGVGVNSTMPGGEYAEARGTSVAAPFVAGTVAVMLSATDHELSPAEIRLGLTATATPAWEPQSVNRTRYGAGLVNARDATAFAVTPSRITGRVTTPIGEPAANVTVTVADGRVRTTTNSSGGFSMAAPSGAWNLTASGFGYDRQTAQVSVQSGASVSPEVQLNERFAVERTSVDAGVLEAGRSFDATLRLANAESITVELGSNSTIDPANVTVFVGGQVVEIGEEVSLASESRAISETEAISVSGALSVEAYTPPGTNGTLDLRYSIRGNDEQQKGRLGSVQVVPRIVSVGVVDVAGSGFGPKVAATLDDDLPPRYRVRNVTAETAPAVADQYDVFVVQRFGNDSGRVGRFLEATDGRATGVVFLGSHANEYTTAPSDAIRRISNTGDERFEVYSGEDGDGPISFELLRDHPLFEGIGTAGDEVEMYDSGPFGDRSWFEQYSGTALATVRANGTAYSGVSVAVDDSRRHVLLTLGRETFVVGTFTESADELLANGVEYVTPSETKRTGPVPV